MIGLTWSSNFMGYLIIYIYIYRYIYIEAIMEESKVRKLLVDDGKSSASESLGEGEDSELQTQITADFESLDVTMDAAEDCN